MCAHIIIYTWFIYILLSHFWRTFTLLKIMAHTYNLLDFIIFHCLLLFCFYAFGAHSLLIYFLFLAWLNSLRMFVFRFGTFTLLVCAHIIIYTWFIYILLSHFWRTFTLLTCPCPQLFFLVSLSLILCAVCGLLIFCLFTYTAVSGTDYTLINMHKKVIFE